MKTVLIASLVGTALAQTSSGGQPGCPCLKTHEHTDTTHKFYIPLKDCDCYDDKGVKGGSDGQCTKPTWNVNGKCILATVQGGKHDYAANYGTLCQAWAEPGHTGCFNLDKSPPVPLPAHKTDAADKHVEGTQAGWCDDPWCYIDPCNCNADDQFESDYFGPLFYSYAVCGSADAYSGVADGSANKGAECAGSDGTSGVEAMKPLMGTLGTLAVIASMW